jgi:hypothetical protein
MHKTNTVASHDPHVADRIRIYKAAEQPNEPQPLIGEYTLSEGAKFLGMNEGWLSVLLDRTCGRWKARGYLIVTQPGLSVGCINQMR